MQTSSIEWLPFQPQIADRMQAGSDEVIPAAALFCRTGGGYWLAWHQGVAWVLAPDTPPDVPCDRVEGAHDPAEVVALIDSGDYAAMEEFDGDDAAWDALGGAEPHPHD